MQLSRFVVAAIFIASSITSSATASMIVGARIRVPFDNAKITVRFNRALPGHTGNLYFMGAGQNFNITIPAHDSNSANIGQLLFDSRGRRRAPVVLDGIFHKGDILYFAYDVVRPRDRGDDLFRSVIRPERRQFAYNRVTGRLGIEDFRRGWKFNDHNYTDMVARILYKPVPVPTPGSMVLFAVGALTCMTRRRR